MGPSNCLRKNSSRMSTPAAFAPSSTIGAWMTEPQSSLVVFCPSLSTATVSCTPKSTMSAIAMDAAAPQRNANHNAGRGSGSHRSMTVMTVSTTASGTRARMPQITKAAGPSPNTR